MPDFIWRGLALALVGSAFICGAIYVKWGLDAALITIGSVFVLAGLVVAYWSSPNRRENR